MQLQILNVLTTVTLEQPATVQSILDRIICEGTVPALKVSNLKTKNYMNSQDPISFIHINVKTV